MVDSLVSSIGLSSVAFKCHRTTQDNPGCLTNPTFKSEKEGKKPIPWP